MSDKGSSLTIGGLAKAADVNVETIRYYQRRGLLPEPQRPPGGIRRYDSLDINRLMFVRTAQRLGFSLEEVGQLLKLEDGTHCLEASTIATQKRLEVQKRIEGLQRIEKVLGEVITQCHAQGDDIHCPLIACLHDGLNAI